MGSEKYKKTEREIKENLFNLCNSISLDEIHFTITKINKILKTGNYPKTYDLVQKLMKLLLIHNLSVKKNTKLFRVRQSISIEKVKIEGLWFPSNEKNCNRGRFNCTECCMAYFADCPETAKNETYYKGSQDYHILESYFFNTDLVTATVPIIDNDLRQISENKVNEYAVSCTKEIVNNFDKECQTKFLTILDFFGKKIVEETDDYGFTNMLGIMLFSGFNMDAFIYPSVKSGLKTNNFVFKPNIANENIKPIRGMQMFNEHKGIGQYFIYDKDAKPIFIGFS